MKSLYASALMCCVLLGCGILGEKSDVRLKANGLTATGNELMADDAPTDETEFATGSELDLLLKGITGYSLKDDKALFGCSMVVTDQSNNKEVLHYDDLFSKSVDGYSKEDAGLLTLTLSIGNSMVAGSTYRWSLRVWDKRGKGELTAELVFKVVEGKDLVGIKTVPTGLKPKLVYILSNGPIKTTDVKTEQKITMVFTEVEGYGINTDSTVSFGASMVVLDKDANAVLEYSDLFQNYRSIPLANATTPSVYLTIGDPMKVGQVYQWKVRLWDKNNQNSMESSILINVVE